MKTVSGAIFFYLHRVVWLIFRLIVSKSITTVSTTAPTTATNDSTTHESTYNGTIVHRLFEGVLTSETRCLTCETVSSRDESFLDLSIDIEQNSSVTACLRQFSASEMLCQKNKFFCDSCCGLQEAEKRWVSLSYHLVPGAWYLTYHSHSQHEDQKTT